MTCRWYVIQTKPKQEARVEAILGAWGIETRFPKVRSSRRRASGTQPMFPGYLFVRFDADERLAKMRYTRGVTRILGTSDGPTPLADDVIDMITVRMDASGVVALGPSFRSGDRVRVTGGPFRDFVAVFEHAATAARRVTVLLATLNAQVRVALDSELIERIG